MRAYELLVELTNNKQSLKITGGIEQDAASPSEPDVRFRVLGSSQSSDSESQLTIPEPQTVTLATLALIVLIANRRQR